MLLKDKVLITGGYSMLGRAIANLFQQKYEIIQLSHNQCDLLNYHQTLQNFQKYKPKFCIHAAGYNGNIQFNQKFPADIFFTTTQIGLNVLTACMNTDVQKIVSLISSCAYPSTTNILKEENFWNGQPDNSVDAHGFSKRIIIEYSRQLYKQYGLISVGMVCNTAYGPYDSYDINKTKIVGAAISKIIYAKLNNYKTVTFWGTGTPRREFIYCDDVAQYCLQVLHHYNDVMLPINVGSGQDITIRELIQYICNITNYHGKIIWDTSMLDGQMKKILDNNRMKQFGISINQTPLLDGLKKTIDWYIQNET